MELIKSSVPQMHALNEPEAMIANAANQFDAQGNLNDETTKKLIRELLINLVSWTRRLQPGK